MDQVKKGREECLKVKNSIYKGTKARKYRIFRELQVHIGIA